MWQLTSPCSTLVSQVIKVLSEVCRFGSVLLGQLSSPSLTGQSGYGDERPLTSYGGGAKSPGTKTRIVSGQRSGICLKSRTGIRLKSRTIGFNNSTFLTGAKKFYNYMGFASQVVH